MALSLDETQEPFLVLGGQNICGGRWDESCHSCMAKHSVSSLFPLDVILAIFPIINAHSPFESCSYATVCFATSTEHLSILGCFGNFSFPGSVVARLSTLDVCGQRETLIIVGCSCQKD